jgi:hypothetical protein
MLLCILLGQSHTLLHKWPTSSPHLHHTNLLICCSGIWSGCCLLLRKLSALHSIHASWSLLLPVTRHLLLVAARSKTITMDGEGSLAKVIKADQTAGKVRRLGSGVGNGGGGRGGIWALVGGGRDSGGVGDVGMWAWCACVGRSDGLLAVFT